MKDLAITAQMESTLSWDYAPKAPALASLYEQGKQGQWDGAQAVDWSLAVPFGERIADQASFGLAAFSASPLARRGRATWDAFCWEFQVWMVSQFLHGEQGALVATARLTESLPDVQAKLCAAVQVADEARHAEVFARYLREKVPGAYPVSQPLEALLRDVIGDSRWDMTAIGMQLIIEPLALATFRLAHVTFHDELIKQITMLVARDEARHVAFGIRILQDFCQQMTASERAQREEFILEAIERMSQRFLLHDIWERMGVDLAEGLAFASTNELMVSYRQAVFAKVVHALTRIGMMSPRVREGLLRVRLLRSATEERLLAQLR